MKLNTAPCQWAGHTVEDGDAESTHLLDLVRPCGHGGRTVPTCPRHTAEKVTDPVANRATRCGLCGQENPVTIVAARPLGRYTWAMQQEARS